MCAARTITLSDALHVALVCADVGIETVDACRACPRRCLNPALRHRRRAAMLSSEPDACCDELQEHVRLFARRLRRDLRRRVLDLPSLRETQRETQLGMQELVAADDALLGAVAEDDAVDAA